jgi:hypothetical protein
MDSTFPLPGEVADEICKYSLKWHLQSMKDDLANPKTNSSDRERAEELIPCFEKILQYYS